MIQLRTILKSKGLVVLALSGILFTNSLKAQESNLFNDSKHRVGFIYGYGSQKYLGVAYEYKINFFQAQYYRSIKRKETWGFDVLFQPQFNTVKYRHVDGEDPVDNGFEYGLNIGFLARKNLYKDALSLYGFISVGPHFVSGTPKRQANGFIFSDNFFIGLNIKLYENIYLDLRPGFRHISNASLKSPNGGVNTVILSGGILVNLN